MTRAEQALALKQIVGTALLKMLALVDEGKAPSEWGKAELCWWIEDRFKARSRHPTLPTSDVGSFERLRQYHIDVVDGRLL